MFDARRRRGGAGGARGRRLADGGEGARARTRSRPCRSPRRASGSSSAPAATPPTSGSGCAASPASLAWTAPRSPEEVADAVLEVARARQQLPRRRAARRRAADAGPRAAALLGRDGHRLGRRARGDDATTAPTRSSRSGTPTARRPRCRATASGSRRAGSRPRAGAAEVTIETGGPARSRRGCSTRSTPTPTWARSPSASRESVDGIELTTASVGNPHAVIRLDDPTREDLLRLGPADRDAPAIPRAHERPARPGRRPARPHRARVGAGGGGDERVRLVVGRRGRRRGRARLVRQPRHGAPAGRRPSRAARRRAGVADRARRSGSPGGRRSSELSAVTRPPLLRRRSRTRATRR